MTTKNTTPPAGPQDAPETPAGPAPDDTTPELAASPWDELAAPVAMSDKVGPGSIKVNVLDSVHAAIRERAEASLAVNAKRVADKPKTDAKRPRVNYHWVVQKFTTSELGAQFDKALARYAKYRPATGDIPFRAEHSPMGQVTCRTGVVCHYRLDSDGVPEVCGEKDEGAFLGLRYSVRPLEQRGDANRLPGTA